MKTLTLMRHAKSDWNHPGLADRERSLNKRGLAAAPEMAARLQARWSLAEQPDRLISSNAVRAQTTAEFVAQALALPLVTEQRLYPFVGAEVAAVIAEQDASVRHLMLVGHNPGISYLAQQLGGLAAADMPTAAVVSMQFDIACWTELSAAQTCDYWFDFPKNPA
jgi:phosphohistidine phosphatase